MMRWSARSAVCSMKGMVRYESRPLHAGELAEAEHHHFLPFHGDVHRHGGHPRHEEGRGEPPHSEAAGHKGADAQHDQERHHGHEGRERERPGLGRAAVDIGIVLLDAGGASGGRRPPPAWKRVSSWDASSRNRDFSSCRRWATSIIRSSDLVDASCPRRGSGARSPRFPYRRWSARHRPCRRCRGRIRRGPARTPRSRRSPS